MSASTHDAVDLDPPAFAPCGAWVHNGIGGVCGLRAGHDVRSGTPHRPVVLEGVVWPR